MQQAPHTNTPSRAELADEAHLAQSRLALILALCFVGMNLRPVLISLGPLLDSVRLALDLSAAAIGFLITLPVLCFGIFAPFVPRLLRYRSAHQLIYINLLTLAVGIGLRSLFGVTGLFAGTLVAGASIAVIMVLLPSLIKASFPAQAGAMMGVYSTALCLGATIAAATTVPLEKLPGSSWRWALAFWLIPALVCAVVWRLQPTGGERPRQGAASSTTWQLYKNKLAWQVTLFMGLQSSIAYCVFGWLPLILIDRGLSALTAGFVLSVTMAVQLITSLTGAWAATRGKDQRAVLAVMLIATFLGLAGVLYGSLDLLWVYTSVMGLGLGGVFSIALALLVLRAPNAQIAAALSGMAQGGGYIIAATGPLIVGLLHEYFGHWHGVAVFFALVLIGSFYFGMCAGRARYITLDPES